MYEPELNYCQLFKEEFYSDHLFMATWQDCYTHMVQRRGEDVWEDFSDDHLTARDCWIGSDYSDYFSD